MHTVSLQLSRDRAYGLPPARLFTAATSSLWLTEHGPSCRCVDTGCHRRCLLVELHSSGLRRRVAAVRRQTVRDRDDRSDVHTARRQQLPASCSHLTSLAVTCNHTPSSHTTGPILQHSLFVADFLQLVSVVLEPNFHLKQQRKNRL